MSRKGSVSSNELHSVLCLTVLIKMWKKTCYFFSDICEFPWGVYLLGIQGRTQLGGEGVRICQAEGPIKSKLRNTDFVDMMRSNILCDLCFSQDQPLTLSDD
jgi:hypothetical protein